MTVSLQHTVLEVIRLAMSKIGVDADTTEAKNLEDAHRNLNLLLGTWSADPDMAVNRMVPVNGYTALTDVVDLPPEYITPLVFTLATMLGPDFDQAPDKLMISMAQEMIANIKINNVRRIGGRIPTNGVLG